MSRALEEHAVLCSQATMLTAMQLFSDALQLFSDGQQRGHACQHSSEPRHILSNHCCSRTAVMTDITD